MSVVFKVKGLQVSVAAVCTRIGSYAAKGREGTRWQGDTWARGKDLAQRETGDRIFSGEIHFQVPGPSGRVSGSGFRVRVQVRELSRTRT